MKRISSMLPFVAAALLLFTACAGHREADAPAYLFTYFTDQNSGLRLAYSYDALTWTPLEKADGSTFLTPVIGKDHLMRDPSICQGPDGTFHMVWTSSWWDRIIGHASSTDLIHWSSQDSIPVMMHEAEARNSWAPELFYDEPSGLFYIFWATTIPGRFPAVSDAHVESGLNHRIYAVTTPDFKTFSPTFLFFNQGFSAIDAAIIKSPVDGSIIMTVKNENPQPAEKNIRISRRMLPGGKLATTLAEGEWSPVSKPIHGDFWAEGPSPLFVHDTLYVYYDCYRDNCYAVSRSTDNGQTWQDLPADQLTLPKGMRHGTAFKVKKQFLQQLIEQATGTPASQE